MRKLVVALVLSGGLLALPAAPALALGSGQQMTFNNTTFCQNQFNPQGNLVGLQNAHSHVPAVPGPGTNPIFGTSGTDMTHAHMAIPDMTGPGGTCAHSPVP